MEKAFSKHWNASKQPRKQRKYLANAPLHIRKKLVSANLSKELRKKHGIRNLSLRKNDVVKVMRGRFKGKKGKILSLDLKESKIEVEGLQVQKKDGSKANVMMKPSNLQITELNLEDNRRIKNNQSTKKTETKSQDKSKNKEDKK